jgi:hypothetical protein
MGMGMKEKSVFYRDQDGEHEIGSARTWVEAEQVCSTLRVPLSAFRGAEGPDGFYITAPEIEPQN